MKSKAAILAPRDPEFPPQMIAPTADDVAAAIVAACRETGDDPVRTAERGLGAAGPANRARHYALHALLHVFPKADRINLCLCVGCPGKPKQFWNASWNQIVRLRFPGSTVHMAGWWSDEVYDRVIRAVEAARTARAVGASVTIPTTKPSADRSDDEVASLRQIKGIEPRVASGVVPPASPFPARPRFAGLGGQERVPPGPIEDKSKLRRMLEEAAANTARQQAADRGEEA